jgi:hypothetical protein
MPLEESCVTPCAPDVGTEDAHGSTHRPPNPHDQGNGPRFGHRVISAVRLRWLE